MNNYIISELFIYWKHENIIKQLFSTKIDQSNFLLTLPILNPPFLILKF